MARYAVVCRNAHDIRIDPKDAPERHGSAFIIGKVRDVVPSTDHEGRWLIRFSEYAVGDFGAQWDSRYPVAYHTTADYRSHEGYAGIDFETLDWRPMPTAPAAPSILSERKGLTIAAAKEGLALHYDVTPEAIEIVIRA